MRHLVTSHANGGTRLYLVDALGTTRPQAYLAAPEATQQVRWSRLVSTAVAVAGVTAGAIAAGVGVIFFALWLLTL